MLYAILKPIAVVLMRLLFRLEAVGREHVPATGPVLIVSNHVSVLDPPLVGGVGAAAGLLPGQGGAVPHPALRAADPGAQRAAGAPGRLGHARAEAARWRLLQEGRAILVFPEGTRGVEGEPPRAGQARGGDARGAERSAGGAGLRVG